MRSAQMSMSNITESICEYICFLLYVCNFYVFALVSQQNDIICQEDVMLISNDLVQVLYTSDLYAFFPRCTIKSVNDLKMELALLRSFNKMIWFIFLAILQII